MTAFKGASDLAWLVGRCIAVTAGAAVGVAVSQGCGCPPFVDLVIGEVDVLFEGEAETLDATGDSATTTPIAGRLVIGATHVTLHFENEGVTASVRYDRPPESDDFARPDEYWYW